MTNSTSKATQPATKSALCSMIHRILPPERVSLACKKHEAYRISSARIVALFDGCSNRTFYPCQARSRERSSSEMACALKVRYGCQARSKQAQWTYSERSRGKAFEKPGDLVWPGLGIQQKPAPEEFVRFDLNFGGREALRIRGRGGSDVGETFFLWPHDLQFDCLTGRSIH